MVIAEALHAATVFLKNAGIEQARLDASVLLCHTLRTDRAGLVCMQDKALPEESKANYRQMIKRRAAHMPVAYLTGHKEFMSLDFKITPAVLIPRPDTEVLCETVIEQAERYEAPAVLDMCCGSGCIGISLAHYLPQTKVSLTDLSEEAAVLAAENAARLAPENTNVFVSDVLQKQNYGLFDILVSNPPYIETGDIAALSEEVRNYEPHMALNGGSDGMLFYTFFARNMQRHLRSGGMLALEVGHAQADAVVALLENQNWQRVQIRCDLAGIKRVVFGFK